MTQDPRFGVMDQGAFFEHEKMDVYAASLELITFARETIRAFPRGKSNLADQLERAATSVALNIAEGAGEFAPKEKVRFYRIALRSAGECAAIIDVSRRLVVVSEPREKQGRELLSRIVAMLTALIRKHEER